MTRISTANRFRIVDHTTAVQVADQALLARSHGDRLRGLLGRTTFPHGEGLWIDPCKAVHTWFMAFPIDLVFLDRSNRIVSLIPDVAPFRVSPVVQRAQSVLELPAGTIAACRLMCGDILEQRAALAKGWTDE